MPLAAAGTILADKYRLERPLSSGGMGSVWVARHVELDVDVAVKLISWANVHRPVVVERFKREARAAAQIRSSNVVQILDYGVHEGVPYMAMELLTGEDLADHLGKHGRISPARALEVLRPICKALDLAHQAGIVHRDIKPANVFLARMGDEEVVKVLDFGIAKETSRAAQHTTGTGLVGSPLYMSPEQMQGSDVDAQTDLWSIAVVLYEALAGGPPHDAPSLPALFQIVPHEDALPLSAKVPDLAAFDAFFARGLCRDKQGRFATVRELLGAFEAAVARAGDVALTVPARASEAARTTDALAPTAHASPSEEVMGVSAKAETLGALADLPSSAEVRRPGTSRAAFPRAWLAALGVGAALAGLGALASGSFTSRGSAVTADVMGAESGGARATASAASASARQPEVYSGAGAPSAPVGPVTASASSSTSAPGAAAPGVPPASGKRPSGPGPAPPPGKSAPDSPAAPPATDPVWGVPVSQPKR